MIATKKSSLPFLTTHVANIALNKQIGLVFLMQEAQETCGLTAVSEESLKGDQLQVGAWMIQALLPFSGDEDLALNDIQPWVEFEPFNLAGGLKEMYNVDFEEVERARELIGQIDAEREALGSLWDPTYRPSLEFLHKIMAQAKECVAYTATRVAAVKVCAGIDPTNPAALLRDVMANGPAMGADLIRGFGGELGVIGIGPLGYLAIKNAITPAMIFASDFLQVVRKVVEGVAIQKGYAKPI